MIFGITVDHTNGGQLIHYYYAEMGLSALSPIFDHLYSLIPTSSILLQKKGNEVWTTPGGNWGQDFGKQVPCSHHYHDNNQIDWRMSSL